MPFILLVWQSLKICTAFGSGSFWSARAFLCIWNKSTTRSCCLLEFHFRTVGFVLQTVSLEEDTLVRHIHKYKFNMWSDQIHIAYLILWIRPVFSEGCPVFICNIFHWRCLGDFIVSLAFKVRFSKVVPILSQSRLKNMSACLFSCIIFRIQLEPHLLKKECESY